MSAGADEKTTVERSDDDRFIDDVSRIADETSKAESESGDVKKDESKSKTDDLDTNREKTPGKEKAGDDEEGKSEGDDEKQDKATIIPDSLVERAVKAGFTLAEVKSFTDSAALERVIGRLESSASTKAGKESEADSEGDEDPLAKLPALNPEEFSPEIVETFKVMKDLLRQQSETIKDLKKNGGDKSGDDFEGWFDQKVSGLGKDYSELVGDGKLADLPEDHSGRAARSVIARHMDVIKEDCKALGKDIPSRDNLFKLALASAFPEKAMELKGKEIAKKATERSRQAVSQPRENDGQFSSAKKGSNPDQEAVDEVSKFFEEV